MPNASFKLNDTEIFSELNQTVTAKNINVAANDTTTPSMAKAWVNFNGAFDASSLTPANQFVLNNGIRAAYNVDYIIDRGTGDFEIHFENAMPDENYAAFVSCGIQSGGSYANLISLNSTTSSTNSYYQAPSNSSIRFVVQNYQFNHINPAHCYVAIFR